VRRLDRQMADGSGPGKESRGGAQIAACRHWIFNWRLQVVTPWLLVSSL
jgi:hypothetical protein